MIMIGNRTITMAEPSTRRRILEAALALFAEQGFRGTSVGEIEAAAGLAPRSGGLYKHFASKEALLEAAFSERMAAIDEFDQRLELTPLGDLRAELTLTAHWALAELRRERALFRVVMKDGERMPALTARFREAIVERGLMLTETAIRRYAKERGVRLEDPEALAQVVCASLVGFNVQQTLFGDESTVADERFIDAWVETTLVLIESFGRSEVNV